MFQDKTILLEPAVFRELPGVIQAVKISPTKAKRHCAAGRVPERDFKRMNVNTRQEIFLNEPVQKDFFAFR